MNKPVYLGFSVSDLSKTVMYEFSYDWLNQNMVKMKSFVISIRTASLFM